MSKINVLVLSPYDGGSHAAWTAGLQRYSGHNTAVLRLPARFWKWRMHGGAVTLARQFLARQFLAQGQQPDVLLATDMLDLTTFLALTRPFTAHIPALLYMHENQLTYPLPADGRIGPMRRQKGERDLHYAFINYASMLAADWVLFNSAYHRESLLAELPRFLRHYPEYQELETIAALQAKSSVLPVGVEFARLLPPAPPPVPTEPPLILWNQRWEYDKNPQAFLAVLYRLMDQDVAFRVALCGEQFGKRPLLLEEALQRLGERVIHAGYAEPETYRQLLWQATVTVSTAQHEFFGISLLEAIYCHTFPVLPHRLSYPELIPPPYHLRCLYQTEGGLLERLRWALAQPQAARGVAAELATAVARYDWAQQIGAYDTLLANAARQPGGIRNWQLID